MTYCNLIMCSMAHSLLSFIGIISLHVHLACDEALILVLINRIIPTAQLMIHLATKTMLKPKSVIRFQILLVFVSSKLRQLR